MTSRIIVPSIKTNATGGQYVIEDPDLSKNRIFIQNQAYDTDTLRSRSNEWFLGQDANLREPTTNPGYYQTPYMITNGKYYYAQQFGSTDTGAAVGHQEPWFASLDYERIPGRHNVMCRSGLIHLGIYYTYTTNVGQQTVWNGYDLTSIPQFQALSQAVNTILFYEDPFAANEWYGIQHDYNTAALGPRLGKLRITGAGPTWTTATGDRGGTYKNNLFFLGINSDSSATFLELNESNQGIKAHRVSTGNQANQIFDWVHPGVSQWHYQHPSNLVHTSDRRKVFYQGGWNNHDSTFQLADEYKDAFFHRFIWDPVTQQFDVKRCTVTYPQGTYHYNYQRTVRYEPSWHSTIYNNWYYKPHVFTVGAQTYLTYMFIDRTTPSYYSYRTAYSRRELNATWVTFLVGSGENDDQLIYHSSYDWPQTRHAVRYVMPINSAGTQLICSRLDSILTLTFDTELGWIGHDEDRISMRSIAQDSTGRIWIATSGANNYYDNTTGGYEYNNGNGGYNMIWEYIPNSPISIKARTLQNTYTYSGSPINSTIIISARNSLADTLVVQTLKLIINGNNAQFNDGSKSITITTSTTGEVQVPFTITGAGQPSISAHVVL
jgi:hypothetical protein